MSKRVSFDNKTIEPLPTHPFHHSALLCSVLKSTEEIARREDNKTRNEIEKNVELGIGWSEALRFTNPQSNVLLPWCSGVNVHVRVRVWKCISFCVTWILHNFPKPSWEWVCCEDTMNVRQIHLSVLIPNQTANESVFCFGQTDVQWINGHFDSVIFRFAKYNFPIEFCCHTQTTHRHRLYKCGQLLFSLSSVSFISFLLRWSAQHSPHPFKSNAVITEAWYRWQTLKKCVGTWFTILRIHSMWEIAPRKRMSEWSGRKVDILFCENSNWCNATPRQMKYFFFCVWNAGDERE